MKVYFGLRTLVYRVADLEAAKKWYTDMLGIAPYYDTPYYVGFNVGGYELGLHPAEAKDIKGPGNAVSYWGVDDVPAVYAALLAAGASPLETPSEVGEGIVVAAVLDPFGNPFGIIRNPGFKPE